MRRQLIVGLGLLMLGCGNKEPQKKPSPPTPQNPQKSEPTKATQPAASALTPTPTSTTAPASTASLALTSLQMSSETVGWGYREPSLYLTQDGGAHWRALPMPTLPNEQGVGCVHLMDPMHLWFTAEPSNTAASIWHTSDGAKTWEMATADLKDLDVESGGFGPFYFTDAAHGWVSFVTSPGMNQHPSKLFSTTDGGKTWTEVSDEALDRISFVDDKNGFAASTPSPAVPAQRLERTTDGGKTWNEVSLTPPKGATLDDFLPFLAVALPNMAHPKDGAIVAPIGESLFLYQTSDAKTWTESPLGLSNEGTRAFVGTAPTSVWAVKDKELSVTVDGGKTWTKSTLEFSADNLLALSVINEKVAFITFSVGDNESALLKTTDSGKTWVKVVMSAQ